MRRSLSNILLLCLLGFFGSPHLYGAEAAAASDSDSFVVYKHPLCFCCKKWIRHLEHGGLTTGVGYRLDMSEVKGQWGVPQGMESCHTAVWHGKYVFEGHVPARYIWQFLADPPQDSFGLSVPGMPAGSPGMYDGKTFEPYNIYLLLRGGDYRFYARVENPQDQ
ncbi:DUF411 domain-containing protein [Microbulbifer taiwanensis]|uniref:DUF411 domain-containing protein n=1 Tax=Microbulbifer taiwanensis TaxID=986746 RepID=A0ABW1YUN2_9GAMM|nr:DUF411 domain-containing protein [Microbulbifer taiwanensis]